MIKILTTPALEIMIFVSPTTSRHVLEKRLRQVVEQRNLPIKVTKINVVKKPEVAEEYDIVACPTLVFSGYMRICGVFEQDDLEEMVTNYFGAIIEGHSNVNSFA